MIKLLFFYILILLIYNPLIARETGETEITTEDGIEVFQEEKYYLLKKNVNIQSDELNLNAQIVKIFFDEDLYDIRELIANDKVDFVSRCFFPQTGVNEDPVTGSAHTLMIPYWSRILGKEKLLAQQLSTRSGKLRCELHGKRVMIGGETAKYMQGEISI